MRVHLSHAIQEFSISARDCPPEKSLYLIGRTVDDFHSEDGDVRSLLFSLKSNQFNRIKFALLEETSRPEGPQIKISLVEANQEMVGHGVIRLLPKHFDYFSKQLVSIGSTYKFASIELAISRSFVVNRSPAEVQLEGTVAAITFVSCLEGVTDHSLVP